MLKIDKIDLRILYELDKSVHTPLSSIAKKINKSPAYTKYRFERLKKNKVIKNATIHLAENREEVMLFITLQGASTIEEKKILDHLFRLTHTNRLFWCDGAHHIIASIFVKELEEIYDIKRQLREVVSCRVDIQAETITQKETFHKKFLHPSKEDQKIISTEKKETEHKELLKALIKQPFATLLELSQITGQSYDSVKYALKGKFPQSTLLLSDHLTDKEALLFTVKNNKKRFDEYIRVHPHIISVDHLLNKTIIIVECLKEERKRDIIKEVLYEFKEDIEDIQKIEIITMYKYQQVIE